MPLTIKQIERTFGRFQYRESTNKRGLIVIDPAWVRANIVRPEMPIVGPVRCHRLIARQLRAALAAHKRHMAERVQQQDAHIQQWLKERR